MPVSASQPSGFGAAAGVASYRVRAMKYADAKNDSALTTNATLRPASAVTRPPIDAPSASIADQVALDSALAGSSSSARGDVGDGRRARRLEERLRADRDRHHDVGDPHLIRAADEQQRRGSARRAAGRWRSSAAAG